MTADDRVDTDTKRFATWAQRARESAGTPAIPAATVVVLRDTPEGPSTLMLRKNSRIAFGGMWVFPGGRIDKADHVNLASEPPDELAAAQAAAAREANEEASLHLDPGAMVLFSHWLPPEIAPKRYATWFFAVAVDRSAVTIDDGEIVDHQWMTPAEAIARHHDGEIELVPPTWVTLHTISGFDTVDAVLESLRRRPPRHYETRIAMTTAGPVAMWGGDAGYATNDAGVAGPRHRLEMFKDGYVYDDSGATNDSTHASGVGGSA